MSRDKHNKKNGKAVYGTADVVRGKNALLYWSGKGNKTSRPLLRLTVSQDLWDALDDEQEKWLIRHLLRYFSVKSTKSGKKFTLRGPDFELFTADLRNP